MHDDLPGETDTRPFQAKHLELEVIIMTDFAPFMIMVLFQNRITVIPVSAFTHICIPCFNLTIPTNPNLIYYTFIPELCQHLQHVDADFSGSFSNAAQMIRRPSGVSRRPLPRSRRRRSYSSCCFLVIVGMFNILHKK